MIFEFVCDKCGRLYEHSSPPFEPPPARLVICCANSMRRIYSAQIDTTGCKDHDDIPPQYRVSNDPAGVSQAAGNKTEAVYQQHIAQRRRDLMDGNKGSIKQTHAVPAHLYHGKLRETGDPNYWRDKKNLDRHKSAKVD